MPDRLEKDLELIDEYINNRLSTAQKLEFYDRLRSDNEFMKLFKQEWELRRLMQGCKAGLAADARARILKNIYVQSRPEVDILAELKSWIVDWILKIAVPSPVLPYINKL
ncbi:MAG TPA: hypothetical protein PK830_06150 [Candidatus Atribacteria bacterium]|nr:hypothetical protein [Candidatus Atribacteria bacterium]HPT78665.1 hypothetical protein [Candidatus Atribacteria bacterium]